jgi:D-arabinose 1-dehydrogenase-like Zn-dependent alcohol dehydrogenase
MKAAVVQQFGRPLVIEDRPIPEPGPGQISVAIDEVLQGRATARLVLRP